MTQKELSENEENYLVETVEKLIDSDRYIDSLEKAYNDVRNDAVESSEFAKEHFRTLLLRSKDAIKTTNEVFALLMNNSIQEALETFNSDELPFPQYTSNSFEIAKLLDQMKFDEETSNPELTIKQNLKAIFMSLKFKELARSRNINLNISVAELEAIIKLVNPDKSGKKLKKIMDYKFN